MIRKIWKWALLAVALAGLAMGSLAAYPASFFTIYQPEMPACLRRK